LLLRRCLFLRRLDAALLVCAALAAAQAPAFAAPDESAAAPVDDYRRHMDAGITLYNDRDYDAALVEFEAAYKDRPGPGPLLDIALCHKGRFDYPKAIEALETALARHGDAMRADDRKAAEGAIAEMRALLGHVTVELHPSHARLFIDDDLVPAEVARAPVALGPGKHVLRAEADGYAPVEQTITVVSGLHDRTVRLALTPDKGYLRVLVSDPRSVVVIDRNPVGAGSWAGLLPPGEHVVEIEPPARAPYGVQVVVAAGKVHEVRPVPTALDNTSPGLPSPPPAPPPLRAREPARDPRGLYGIAAVGVLFPVRHPEAFQQPEPSPAGVAGVRLGYRVNARVGFEALFEYGSVYTPSDADTAAGYTLSSARFALGMRLMSTGKRARVVWTLGGGVVHDRLSFDLGAHVIGALDGALPDAKTADQWSACRTYCRAASGLDPFAMTELGFELDFGGVIAGLSLQLAAQSTRGIKTDAAVQPYEEPVALWHAGGGLRVGYTLW
jgi:hypothetical protein